MIARPVDEQSISLASDLLKDEQLTDCMPHRYRTRDRNRNRLAQLMINQCTLSAQAQVRRDVRGASYVVTRAFGFGTTRRLVVNAASHRSRARQDSSQVADLVASLQSVNRKAATLNW